MVQSFIVLKCYADGCATHQVQQVKKSTKWTCVVCGAKQTLKKVLFEGPAPACRAQAQAMNMRKATIERERADQQAVPAAEPDDTCELYSEPHDASSYLQQQHGGGGGNGHSVESEDDLDELEFDDPSQSYNLSSCRARGQPASIARHQAAGSHSFGQAATDIGSQSRRTGVSTAQVMTPPASNSGSTAAAASIVTRLLQDARRDLSKLSDPAPPAQRTSKWATFMPARRNNQDADDDDEDLS